VNSDAIQLIARTAGCFLAKGLAASGLFRGQSETLFELAQEADEAQRGF
jgi:hypothetical protein